MTPGADAMLQRVLRLARVLEASVPSKVFSLCFVLEDSCHRKGYPQKSATLLAVVDRGRAFLSRFQDMLGRVLGRLTGYLRGLGLNLNLNPRP